MLVNSNRCAVERDPRARLILIIDVLNSPRGSADARTENVEEFNRESEEGD